MDANRSDATPQSPAELAEPQRLSVQVQRIGDSVSLVNTQRQWASAAFLLLWLTLWSVGCVVLLGVVIFQFSFLMLLFALPFWAAWLLVASMVGSMIASRETLTLEEAGATYCRTVFGIPITHRKIPLREITSFTDAAAAIDNDTSPVARRFAQRMRRLEMTTIGTPLRLTATLTDEELPWLVHSLNTSLESLKRYSGPIERPPHDNAPALDPAALPPVLELRPPSAGTVSRPSEAAWELETTLDFIAFVQRGRLSISALGGVLFVTVFWNSIVGIFVAGLLGFLPDGQKGGLAKGGEWWFLFFFLIPFELIGLVFVVALLVTLLEPVRRSRWILYRNAIAYRVTRLGLGTTKRYEINQLDRLELRKESEEEDDSDTKRGKGSRFQPENEIDISTADKPSGPRFSLALIGKDGADACEIENLSLGEACWMADVILHERAGWFA